MDRDSDEVQKHLKQAIHNYKFFCEVHSKLPDVFFDWKITVLFYTSIHLLRALLTERDVSVDNSHSALRKAINPSKGTRPVKPHCYDSYVTLYNASLDVRYSGFLDVKQQSKYLQKRFKTCQKALKSIDSYMKGQGYKSLMPIQKEFKFKENQ